MAIKLINKFDKYGFALKSVKRAFYEQPCDPYIEIKYITNNKRKNINNYGYAFKDFTYSFNTENQKEIIKEIYLNIKDKDIIEATKYLLEQFPKNANQIITDIPSYIITNKEFYNYLQLYISKLSIKDQAQIENTLNKKLKGIDMFMKRCNVENSQIL